MNQSSVSVVIPAHNGARFIAQALESVFAQTMPVHDVWVIDNGSTDATRDIVAAFPGVSYIHTETANVGAARQQGVEHSSGQYIAFLDQDDTWVPHKTKQQVSYLESNPQAGAVIGSQRMFVDSGSVKPHWLKESFLNTPLPGYLPSALMVRREAFETSGGFNTHYLMNSDVDWFFKAQQTGLNVGMVDCVVVEKRIHADNDSNNVAKSQSELLKVIKQSLILRRTKHAA